MAGKEKEGKRAEVRVKPEEKDSSERKRRERRKA